MTPHVFPLVTGHGQKLTWDPGAQADANHDGRITPDETEAIRNQVQAKAIRAELLARGVPCEIFAVGSYPVRVDAALAWMAGRPGCVVHVHGDGHGCAGRMVLHHVQSRGGAKVATKVAQALDPIQVRPVAAWDDRGLPGGNWRFNSAHLCSLTLTAPPDVCSIVLEIVTVDDPREMDVEVGRRVALGLLS